MQGSLDNEINQDFQDAIDVMQRHSEHSEIFYCNAGKVHTPRCGPVTPLLRFDLVCDRAPFLCLSESWSHVAAETSPWAAVEAPTLFPLLPERLRKGRKKLRLYEYLHEALHDAGMADSIQWTDRGSGTFHFISKNKERLAKCWGQRKGNRKAMTYQKMARALRNYSRTGEIVKVRRKLTYQFNPLILQRLESPAELGFYHSPVPEWHSWCGQYPFQGECDLTTVLTADGGRVM
uniref:ETS domain-containing protein n=1 Tax=Electrophorus electricus TaxID=8005 RepID=A0A4W4GGT1_ELEEL